MFRTGGILIYDEQKQDFIEAEQVNAYADAESNSTVQVYRNLITGDSEKVEIINGLYSLQERTINGKTTQLQFDEQGCLLGYVIQPGETPDSIAQKFGISKELLLRANNNSAFMTLDTIRIPKQVSIDDPAVQDMKTKHGSKWNQIRESISLPLIVAFNAITLTKADESGVLSLTSSYSFRYVSCVLCDFYE